MASKVSAAHAVPRFSPEASTSYFVCRDRRSQPAGRLGNPSHWRWGLRVRGWDPAKPINIPELVTVTSVLFALMLSFSAAGVWNDWQQAQGAVRREALALENVIGLANGLPPERGQKLKERVLAYTKAAADHEWPVMARRADTDDPIFK